MTDYDDDRIEIDREGFISPKSDQPKEIYRMPSGTLVKSLKESPSPTPPEGNAPLDAEEWRQILRACEREPSPLWDNRITLPRLRAHIASLASRPSPVPAELTEAIDSLCVNLVTGDKVSGSGAADAARTRLESLYQAQREEIERLKAAPSAPLEELLDAWLDTGPHIDGAPLREWMSDPESVAARQSVEQYVASLEAERFRLSKSSAPPPF